MRGRSRACRERGQTGEAGLCVRRLRSVARTVRLREPPSCGAGRSGSLPSPRRPLLSHRNRPRQPHNSPERQPCCLLQRAARPQAGARGGRGENSK